MSSLISKLGLIAILTCFVGALHLHADDEAWEQAEPATVSVEELEDGKLEAFATAYQDIINVATEYEQKFVDAGDDPQEAARLQQEANAAMVDIIENQDDLTIEEYNLIVTSMRSDEELQNAVHDLLDS